jgi:hypothetical protein
MNLRAAILRRCAALVSLSACGAPSGTPSPASAGGTGSQPDAATPGTGTFGFAGPPGSGSCVPAAPQTFANAVCVCGDLVAGGTLDTIASSQGAANVGVNGGVAVGVAAAVDGSLFANQSLDVVGAVTVRDDVTSTGNVLGGGLLHVGGDLSVGGQFVFGGLLSVGGLLRAAQPSTILIPLGPIQTGPYVAPAGPPCGCDPASLLPIAADVTAAATNNDNAAHGLGTDAASFLGLGDLTLSTGKYYFRNATDLGAGRITIDGSVALYFDGSLATLGVNQLAILPGSSLDVYVSGAVLSAGAALLGDPAHPEAFRLFVGGAGSIVAAAGADGWNGLVYAPQAAMDLGGISVVNGAILARSLAWAGILSVNYEGMGASATSCVPGPTGPAPTGPSATPQ